MGEKSLTDEMAYCDSRPRAKARALLEQLGDDAAERRVVLDVDDSRRAHGGSVALAVWASGRGHRCERGVWGERWCHEIGTIVPFERGSGTSVVVLSLDRHDRAGQGSGGAMDALGQDIRARRRELGLRQQDVADLALTSERFVRELESGKATVRLDKLRAVLDVLGLDLRAELRRE